MSSGRQLKKSNPVISSIWSTLVAIDCIPSRVGEFGTINAIARGGFTYGERITLKNLSRTATFDLPIVLLISSERIGPDMIMIALSRRAH